MKRLKVGILIFDDVEVLDFAGPFEVLSRARTTPGVESRRSDGSAPFHVFTIADRRASVTATGGLEVVPGFDFTSAPPLDILLVPGGFGTRVLLESAPVLAWIREAAHRAAHVCSVCTGSLLLARAGLLGGKRATTHWSALGHLADLDPAVTVVHDERVVDDGILTSAGVAAGIDMAFALVERVCGRAVAEDTARYIEYPLASPLQPSQASVAR
jgi:transcriptional regulator GlxA family with amidase domain